MTVAVGEGGVVTEVVVTVTAEPSSAVVVYVTVVVEGEVETQELTAQPMLVEQQP